MSRAEPAHQRRLAHQALSSCDTQRGSETQAHPPLLLFACLTDALMLRMQSRLGRALQKRSTAVPVGAISHHLRGRAVPPLLCRPLHSTYRVSQSSLPPSSAPPSASSPSPRPPSGSFVSFLLNGLRDWLSPKTKTFVPLRPLSFFRAARDHADLHAYTRGGAPSHVVLPAAASADSIDELLAVLDALLPPDLQKAHSFLMMEDRLVDMQQSMTAQRVKAVADPTRDFMAEPDSTVERDAQLDLPPADCKQLLALMQGNDLPRGASVTEMMYGELTETIFTVHADTMELLCNSPARWGELRPEQLMQMQRYACEQAYVASIRLLENVERTLPLAFKKSYIVWRAWSVLLESSLRLGKHADVQAAGHALRLYADQWCAEHREDDKATARIVRETVEAVMHEKLGRASAIEGKWAQAHSHFHRAIEAQRRQIHTPLPADFDEQLTDGVECLLFGGVSVSAPLDFEMRVLQSASHAALKRGAVYLPLALSYAVESLKLAHMDPQQPQLDRLDAAVKINDMGISIAESVAGDKRAKPASSTLPSSVRDRVESSFAAALPVVSAFVTDAPALRFDLLRELVDVTKDGSLHRRAERMWAAQRRAQTCAAAYQQIGRVLDTVPKEAAQRIQHTAASKHTSASNQATSHSPGEMAAMAFDAAVQLAITSAPTARSLERFKQSVWGALHASKVEQMQEQLNDTDQHTTHTHDKQSSK